MINPIEYHEFLAISYPHVPSPCPAPGTGSRSRLVQSLPNRGHALVQQYLWPIHIYRLAVSYLTWHIKFVALPIKDGDFPQTVSFLGIQVTT